MAFILNEVDRVEIQTLQDNYKEMPDKFLLNMSGTRMVFAA